jgi:hypothetical protein
MLRVALAANRRAAQHQLRQRMRSDPARQRQPVPEAPARPAYGGFLLRAGAVAGLAAAAILLGPIPVTGLSGSPAAAAARFAANHLGVSETEQAPPAPGDSTTVTGVEITAADAATGAGLSFAAAPELMGLTLSSQRYFESTASFVATYSSDGASISVFEEAAGGSELSVPEGVASTVMVNGMQATYYEGSWSETDGALTWQPEGTQTVVFERDGVRFTVVYSGPAVDGFDLAEAAAAI